MAITPLERVLVNDLNLAIGKLSAEAVRAHDQIEAHDRRVEEMPWYQRAFSYRERREERAELVRHFDRAALRAEVAHEVADVMHEALKQHQQAVERQPQLEREPELTREATYRQRFDLQLHRTLATVERQLDRHGDELQRFDRALAMKDPTAREHEIKELVSDAHYAWAAAQRELGELRRGHEIVRDNYQRLVTPYKRTQEHERERNGRSRAEDNGREL